MSSSGIQGPGAAILELREEVARLKAEIARLNREIDAYQAAGARYSPITGRATVVVVPPWSGRCPVPGKEDEGAS